MTTERDRVLELCRIIRLEDAVLEEVEAVFLLPVPHRLNLFDYLQVGKLCDHYETTYAGSVQTHMLVREIEASPFAITVDLISSGEGSLKSGGVYLKPGDTIEVRVSVASNVRKVSVKLLGLIFSHGMLH